MTENEKTPRPQPPVDGSNSDENETEPENKTIGETNPELDPVDTPLDVEAREWDIDITQSEGPVLEDGPDLDTGAGRHRPRP